MTSREWPAFCMRGHFQGDLMEETEIGHYCGACGAPVIAHCPNCNKELSGTYRGALSLYEPKPENFCSGCGSPLPWADRQVLVMQLWNQLEFEPGLDAADRLVLKEQIDVLAQPDADDKARVKAGERIKGLAPKAWGLAQPILQSLISAELQRRLGIPPG